MVSGVDVLAGWAGSTFAYGGIPQRFVVASMQGTSGVLALDI